MCCIFGIGLLKDHKLKSSDSLIGMISVLLREAEIGGRQASGVALMLEKKAKVLRRALSGSQMASSYEYLAFMSDHVKIGKDAESENQLQSVIGHCRLPTQGSPSNHYNNHPILTGHIVGVHNGVIGNNHVLFEDFKKSFTRIAEVDTEIIFQLINYFSGKGEKQWSSTVDAIQKTTPYLQGYYACAALNSKSPRNLYLFRHSAPIKILYYPKVKVLFFATFERFIETAVSKAEEDMGKPIEIDLLDDKGIAFNLYNSTMHKFGIRNYRMAQSLRGSQIC